MCVSRCEANQDHLVRRMGYSTNLYCRLGDIKDQYRMDEIFEQEHPDVVFHLAAYKMVDRQEEDPYECVKTNVIGTYNVLKSASRNRVKTFILSSTDKAVDPINVYGNTKSLAEKIVLSNVSEDTRTMVYRWGNVIGSRGSVIPFFIKSLTQDRVINITSIKMTRFWITLDAVVSFLIATYTGFGSKVRIPEIKAASTIRVAEIIAKILNISNYEVKIIGPRPGEKLHEFLTSKHLGGKSSYRCEQYTDEELTQLIEPFVKLQVG